MKTIELAMAALVLGAVIGRPGDAGAQSLVQTAGAGLYAYYCASCHGSGGEGDGSMAAYLKVTVPDLTTLSRRNGGTFPLGPVIEMIDGTKRPPGHSGPMPVFSDVFVSELDPDTAGLRAVIDQQGRILALARFVEAIQK